MLTSENRKTIKTYKDPEVLARALRVLNNANMLTSKNRKTIKTHKTPEALVEVLEVLYDSNILTQDNFDVITHKDPEVLAGALRALNNANMLTQNNFDAIKIHNPPEALVEGLEVLYDANMLTQNNFDAIKIHKTPEVLVEALRVLYDANMLTQNNFYNPEVLVEALRVLYDSNMLTQDSFDLGSDITKAQNSFFSTKQALGQQECKQSNDITLTQEKNLESRKGARNANYACSGSSTAFFSLPREQVTTQEEAFQALLQDKKFDEMKALDEAIEENNLFETQRILKIALPDSSLWEGNISQKK